jgi:hypothetical protein
MVTPVTVLLVKFIPAPPNPKIQLSAGPGDEGTASVGLGATMKSAPSTRPIVGHVEARTCHADLENRVEVIA